MLFIYMLYISSCYNIIYIHIHTHIYVYMYIISCYNKYYVKTSDKKQLINASCPGNVTETILTVITSVKLVFFRNYHNIKYIKSHKLHRCLKNSVKHPKWSFAKLVNGFFKSTIFPKKLRLRCLTRF